MKSGPGRWDLVYVSKRTALLQDWVHHIPPRNKGAFHKGAFRPIARVPSENRFMNDVIRDDLWNLLHDEYWRRGAKTVPLWRSKEIIRVYDVAQVLTRGQPHGVVHHDGV